MVYAVNEHVLSRILLYSIPWAMVEKICTQHSVINLKNEKIDVLACLGGHDKDCRFGAWNKGNLFLTLLDAGKSKIKISAGCGSWWGSLTGLQMATFFLHYNMVEVESSPVSFSLYQASALLGHLNLMTSLQALSPSTVTLRTRASTYEQWWVCVQNSVNGPNYSLINNNHCVFELII